MWLMYLEDVDGNKLIQKPARRRAFPLPFIFDLYLITPSASAGSCWLSNYRGVNFRESIALNSA